MPLPELERGSIVAQEYTVGSIVGSIDALALYEARDDHHVAVVGHAASTEWLTERRRVLAELESAGFVPIESVVVEDDFMVVVFGSQSGQMVEHAEPLPDAACVELGIALLTAIAEAQKVGIRPTITPFNVLIDGAAIAVCHPLVDAGTDPIDGFAKVMSKLVGWTPPWLAAALAESREPAALIAALRRHQPTATIADENVQFTVYRPKAVRPQKWYDLLAFAHLDEARDDDEIADPIEEVERQARRALGEDIADYRDTTADSRAAVPRYGELTFLPEIDGVEFNPPRQTLLWAESVHRADFRMRADKALDGTNARGRMSVFLGSILLADVPLRIQVSGSAKKKSKPDQKVSARPYRKIFASYSHKDLAIVEQFEKLAAVLGDRYLRDWKDLRAGEKWSERLSEMIVEADVFQLFWSSSSMGSPFVKSEWEQALALQREGFVRPVYWETPMPTAPGLPPPDLAALHFQHLGVVSAGTHPDMKDASAWLETDAPAVEKRENSLRFSLRTISSDDATEDELGIGGPPKAAQASPTLTGGAPEGMASYRAEMPMSLEASTAEKSRSSTALVVALIVAALFIGALIYVLAIR